jgi:hypothetical protein
VKRTLEAYVRQDPRILRVYLEARKRYDQAGREHHNFQHVLRDLYRALAIAETEESVDFTVLIPSVLLHDIGFFDPEFRTRGHEETGAELGRGLLAGLGYEETTIEAVVECIRAHKGRASQPLSLEAKILYDADVLEKAGLFALILGGKLICEFQETLEDYVRRESADRAEELSRGFYTAKGRELDGGRLARTCNLLTELKQEVEKDRPDYSITERDLWVTPPPE